MATITVDLNGGDIGTNNNDLTYKLYGGSDSYTNPILNIDSANTNGNVSINGDIATISNVNIGSETNFKISTVDNEGNESLKSAEFVYNPSSTNVFTDSKLAIHLKDLGLGTTNVVRVRRDSDDAEQDFSATQITDGSLATFCGAGNGFVTIGYDQQGLYNAIQTTLNYQPKIVDSGSLIIEDGHPVIKFDGVDDYMEIAYGSNSNNTYAMKVVNNSDAGYKYIFGADNGGGHSNLGIQGQNLVNTFRLKDSGTQNDITTTYPVGSGMNIFITRNGTTELYINNSLEVSQTVTPIDISGIHLGAYKGQLFSNISFRGFAVWESDESSNRTDIQNEMNS